MITENIFHLVIVLVLFGLIFALAEFLFKRKVPPYITRKVVHIGSGLVAALLPLLVKLETVVILGIGFFLLLILSKRRSLLNSIHKINDDSIGAILFAPSLTLAALIFWPINIIIFQGVALVLGLSDGIAGIVGMRYGRKKYKITGVKTIEGSLTFFVITFLVLCAMLYINGALISSKILPILVWSLLLTITKAMFGRGWDNLFISLFSGLAFYFIL